MKRIPHLLLMLSIVCLLTTAVFAASVDTELAAKSLAATYATKLGWQYGAPTSVTLSRDESLGDRWDIRFSDRARMTIDQATGEFLTMTDCVRFEKLPGGGSVEPGDVAINVGQDEARMIAERYLSLFKMPDEIAFGYEMQDRTTKLWIFAWTRAYYGIPYDSPAEGVRVCISPIDGVLTSYGRGFIAARPRATEIRVAQQDAISAARQIAGILGLPNSESMAATADLKVVQRNGYWSEQPILNYSYPGAPSQVAWVVVVSTGQAGSVPESVLFWIDATTGELLGGTQSMGGHCVAKRLSKKVIAAHHAKVQKKAIRKLQKTAAPAK